MYDDAVQGTLKDVRGQHGVEDCLRFKPERAAQLTFVCGAGGPLHDLIDGRQSTVSAWTMSKSCLGVRSTGPWQRIKLITISACLLRPLAKEHVKLYKGRWPVGQSHMASHVVFCDISWTPFADKHSTAAVISNITGIDTRYLVGRGLAQTASVATRMSWFSKRNTTRREDMAYRMLGIFDVDTALLYGEGDRAFLRLQMKIMRKANDQTIFALEGSGPSHHPSLLASSPRDFAHLRSLIRYGDRGLHYTMTQHGLELRVTGSAWLRRPGPDQEAGYESCYTCAKR